MIKQKRCLDDECEFCRDHVDIVTNDLLCSGEPIKSICLCKEVRFLLYCIQCDQVMVGYITREFKYLLKIKFGLENIDRCSERSHDTNGIRCMMIDTGRKKKSDWEKHLAVPVIDVGSAISWKPLMECHLHNTWKDLNIAPLNPKSKGIIYLIYCLKCKIENCDTRYVGRTANTFRERYAKGLDSATPLVKKHFKDNQTNCSDIDYKWMVIDTLSDMQISFLRKWESAFDQFNVADQKKIWLAINETNNESLKTELFNLVLSSSTEEENQLISDIHSRLVSVKLPSEAYWTELNPENKEMSVFLNEASNMWIKNTNKLFLEKREDHWMNKLNTKESEGKVGLNKLASGQSKIIGGNFYIDEFRNLNINA